MSGEFGLWIGFGAVVLTMLVLDLGVWHRRAHAVSLKEAAVWTAVWVTLAMLFAWAVYTVHGPQPAFEFLTGYLIEEALSVDNIFVFVLILSLHRIPPIYQHRVLGWGVLGAIGMRGALIALGTTLVRFEWVLYGFGAFLVLTGLKMAVARTEPAEPGPSRLLRIVRRLIPVAAELDGEKFFTQKNGRTLATPLLLVLILIEFSDLLFAVDSIPAIFAVTRDPFLIYTSNIFAILGLRQLYFLLAGLIDHFRFLKSGLAVILLFVGTKMLLAKVYEVPTAVSLGTIAGTLLLSVLLSVLLPDRRSGTGEVPAAKAAGAAPPVEARVDPLQTRQPGNFPQFGPCEIDAPCLFHEVPHHR